MNEYFLDGLTGSDLILELDVVKIFGDLQQKTFLRCSCIYMVYFVSADDFGDVEVILEQM